MIHLHCQAAQPELYMKLSEWGINGVVTLCAVLIASYLTYRYALKRLRKETEVLIEREKYKRALKSLEACWKLLAYTTATENNKSILTFVKKPGDKKTWFANTGHAQEFMQALAQYFYHSGLGLYLPETVKKLLFEYRSILYGLVLATKQSPEKIVEVNKPEMKTRMIEIHQELIKELREKLGVHKPGSGSDK